MEGKKKENVKEESEKKKNTNFECNICFDDVNEPVVTRCGHLFCWSCLLSWMNRRNYQCPICQAGISRENVIPLYGHGQNQTDPRNKPEEPRPKAERPSSEQRGQPFFRGYEGGVSISFGAFPFSFVLPFGVWSSSNGQNLSSLFGMNQSTHNMTPEQRRAYTNSVFLVLVGVMMLGYILFFA
ncbi:RING-type E3 ubiquitin transferase [Theileria orientalis]|uniref:RING-type E3 ubiquitin transferase n=1 Tax=Theileria orientalis TaxID=68886 RepID=A0A976ME59_THEOR|nr:RING-type E3 ubiquitin transferase [Theileria orientalis]